MIDEGTIHLNFGQLIQAKRKYHTSANLLIAAKHDLEVAKLAGMLSGAIDGKNAELREASARNLLADKYTVLETAEINERNDRFELDLAELGISRLRTLLQLTEILQHEEQLHPLVGFTGQFPIQPD